jgi:hypothetical protein
VLYLIYKKPSKKEGLKIMETRNENVVQLAGKLVELKKVWTTSDMIICEGTL